MALLEEQLEKLALNGNTDKPVNSEAVRELDALIVGAGFGGVWQLKRLRDEGYKVKLVECGTDYGGVWYWNRYPGARVDSAIPFYEFSDPELWEEWVWKQRFPGSGELRSYFAFVADKWDLRKDTEFETFVSSATWDDNECKWTVCTKAGQVLKVKFLSLNTGFAAKRYIPNWKGVDTFEGEYICWFYSSNRLNHHQESPFTPLTGHMRSQTSKENGWP
jgi:cation diffusion facilitator CzcD-associated flavoprotein CzcO